MSFKCFDTWRALYLFLYCLLPVMLTRRFSMSRRAFSACHHPAIYRGYPLHTYVYTWAFNYQHGPHMNDDPVTLALRRVNSVNPLIYPDEHYLYTPPSHIDCLLASWSEGLVSSACLRASDATSLCRFSCWADCLWRIPFCRSSCPDERLFAPHNNNALRISRWLERRRRVGEGGGGGSKQRLAQHRAWRPQ